MVKRFVLFMVIAFAGAGIYAQESGFTFRPFFGGGGGTVVFDGTGGFGVGGLGEYAFLVFDRGLQVGTHILARGDSITTPNGNNFGAASVSGRISLGGFFPGEFVRGYSFVESGIGFAGGNGTRAANFIFGGGGGFDFFVHERGSIYLEVGYLQHSLNNERVGGVAITIGSRGHIR